MFLAVDKGPNVHGPIRPREGSFPVPLVLVKATFIFSAIGPLEHAIAVLEISNEFAFVMGPVRLSDHALAFLLVGPEESVIALHGLRFE